MMQIKIVVKLLFKVLSFFYKAYWNFKLIILYLEPANEFTIIQKNPAFLLNNNICFSSLPDFIENQIKDLDILDKRYTEKLQNTYASHTKKLLELNEQMLKETKNKSPEDQKLLMAQSTEKKYEMLKKMAREYLDDFDTHKIWLSKLMDLQKEDLISFLKQNPDAKPVKSGGMKSRKSKSKKKEK
jgi:hypothetical protein